MRWEWFVHVMQLNVVGNDENVSKASNEDVEYNGAEITVSSIDKIQSAGAFKHGMGLETPDWARPTR
jgi:hypothetical protein